MGRRRRRPVDPTDDWEQLELLCLWEGLARCEVAVRLGDGEMAVEYGGRTLSRYDVSLSREAKLEAVTNPRLFAARYQRSRPQLRLFELQASLGDSGWPKALRLDGYAARIRRRPEAL